MTNNLKGKDSPVKFLAILGLLIVAGFGFVRHLDSTDPVNLNPPFVSSYTATQLSCQANAQHRIDELGSLLSKIDCGNFLDAPVGIKHCVAERATEDAIAIERAQFDSCTK
jgi:hypothetical protein